MFNLSKDEITFEVVEDFCREWEEGVRVEYKQEIHKDIPKTLSSFANTQGGVLIIGVEADKTHNKVKFPIKGIPKTDNIEERIVQSGLMGIHPPVMSEVIILEVPSTANIVVVVRVDESVQAPHAIQNSTKVYIRVASVSQPYEKPQLAELDYIEYLLNRSQETQKIASYIIDQLEKRTQQFLHQPVPKMTVIARPVFPYRSVISLASIYKLYKADSPKRVMGGVSCFSGTGSNENLEINEHGIVYYSTELLVNRENNTIDVNSFIAGINEVIKAAKTLYQECDYLGNIEVSVRLQNVQNKGLSDNSGRLRPTQTFINSACSDDEFEVTTSKYYLLRDFNDQEHQRDISEDLIFKILWTFDIPNDNGIISDGIRKFIREKSGIV
ncbi:MAG: ATP-binding protein [Candidatus Poribacteria bacterium]|nr:ATP-binding protein [Candidatus Poribacteria bacterium]